MDAHAMMSYKHLHDTEDMYEALSHEDNEYFQSVIWLCSFWLTVSIESI